LSDDLFSEEAPKPEDTTDGTKSTDAQEGKTSTATQTKTKKKEEQTVMTNIESLYFADTFLFQGLPCTHTDHFNLCIIISWPDHGRVLSVPMSV